MPSKHRSRPILVLAALALAVATPAGAVTSGPSMPWDTGVANLAENITGPTAYFFVLIAIVITGLYWAFTRHSEGGNRLAQIIFGAAIALGAVALLTALGISAAIV